jgi:hypothetical protein
VAKRSQIMLLFILSSSSMPGSKFFSINADKFISGHLVIVDIVVML